MSMFKGFKRISNFKLKVPKMQAGMSYVEFIVVLGIFSVITAIVLFNYKTFQARVDVKILASEVALKIVEAQKSAMSGKLPPAGFNFLNPCPGLNPPQSCKPSYGVFFDKVGDNSSKFYYFVDLNGNGLCDDILPHVPGNTCDHKTGEVLEIISMNKGNKLALAPPTETIRVRYAPPDNTSDCLKTLSVTFTRPSSTAEFKSWAIAGNPCSDTIDLGKTVNYAQINFVSPGGEKSYIRVFRSGRITIDTEDN